MVQDADLYTEGYFLEMLADDDTWLEVFSAPSNPDALSTTVFGLKTGKLYKFRVFAQDFNGASEPSSILEAYACGLPKYFSEPRYVWSTQTSIAITWDPPRIDGGCPVSDYRVERDSDGTGATWTEVNPVELYPRNDPFIDSFNCELFPEDAQVGDLFRFRVIAFNT
jgi:hypothetical protein